MVVGYVIAALQFQVNDYAYGKLQALDIIKCRTDIASIDVFLRFHPYPNPNHTTATRYRRETCGTFPTTTFAHHRYGQFGANHYTALRLYAGKLGF